MHITLPSTRLQRVSQIGQGICTLLLIGTALALILILYGVSAAPEHRQATTWQKFEIGVSSSLVLAFWFMGVWLMRALFCQFRAGAAFTLRSVRLLQWLGVWHLAQGVVFLSTLVLTGVFLLALGWVLELGATLKEENDFTV